jgi:CheY-like chemotaxis protein
MPPKKILLAEDDSDDGKLFYDYLSERDDVALQSIVENGIRLFEYLDNLAAGDLPDLIVLDQNMPKKNGIQTLEQLKSDHNYSGIPVVIYSTYADNQLVHDCSLKGAVMVVSKPLSFKGYHEMMDRFLAAIETRPNTSQ